MVTLKPQKKAKRIVELFRSRRPTAVLLPELYPASLDEAYAIRRAFQEIEETERAGRRRRLQDRAYDPGHAEALRG